MRSPVALAVVVAVLALSGCRAADPVVVPQPEPTSTPLFASDEEALAAAEEAYAAYQSAEDLIANEGGANPDRIARFAVRSALEGALAGFEKYVSSNTHSVGSTGFSVTSLQSFDSQAVDGADVVAAYVCLDLTYLDVVDSAGKSLVSPDRPSLQAFEIVFDVDRAGSLVLSSRTPWTGDGVCGS